MGCGASTQSPPAGSSAPGKGKYNMKEVFMQFDADGDGKLDIHELARAFRALGLPKRDGDKLQMDQAMFKSFDTNGDGFCSPEELEKNLYPKTRKKIEEKLDAGWKFNKKKWDESVARHKRWDMSKVFKQFDSDGDGELDIHEFARAFRALGLPKRDGAKLDVDRKMFDSFDTNGNGKVSLKEIEENLTPKTRKKIEEKLDSGWKFDKPTWEASVARHARWNMEKVFMQFDADGDGKLSISELARAFRAFGLEKRTGAKLDVDKEMFASFDTNGDGQVTPAELEHNLKPKTRKKIEEKLDGGWKFDAEKWKASAERHARWNMAKVFKSFDTDGDGKLPMRDFMRAFRALGLEKRSGEKMKIDEEMFKQFDTNGDGAVTLEEFEANLLEKTRQKIVDKLDAGWTFDGEKWEQSQARHANDGAAPAEPAADAPPAEPAAE